MKAAAVRTPVKVAMSGNGRWHLLDTEGVTYCGESVPRLRCVRTFASLAAAESEDKASKPDPKSRNHLCAACVTRRRERGDA